MPDEKTSRRIYKLSWQEDSSMYDEEITDRCRYFTSRAKAEDDYDILAEKEATTMMKIEVSLLKAQPSNKMICEILNKENIFLTSKTIKGVVL